MRTPILSIATLAALAAGACSYGYKNPAEALSAGEVAGRTTAGGGAVAEVSIALKGSVLEGSSRQGGQFGVVPLPVGSHTLVFRKGKDRAVQRDVEVVWGKDGQPEGLWLGDVEVPATAAVRGSAQAEDLRTLADNGLVVDEVTGLTVPVLRGVFVLDGLPLGLHRLRVWATDTAGVRLVSGPREVTLGPSDAGFQRQLSPALALHPATASTATLKFRLRVVGDAPGLSLSQVTVTGLPVPVTFDSTGLAQVSVPEGKWTVGVTLPGTVPAVSAPPEATFVAAAGDSVDLGTLYAVGDAAAARALLACHQDADCAPGGRCAGGACQGWSPPAAAPASVGFCDAGSFGCAPGPYGGIYNGATYGPPYAALCLAGSFPAGSAAASCGSCCTPDGVQVLCAPASSPSCQVP